MILQKLRSMSCLPLLHPSEPSEYHRMEKERRNTGITPETKNAKQCHILQMCTHTSLRGLLVGLQLPSLMARVFFRSSMPLIAKLWTALCSINSLGKIDCVLKSSPLFTKVILITVYTAELQAVVPAICSH